MADIISDNKEVEYYLNKLVELVEKNGGYINPLLYIKEEDNNFSILSDLAIGINEKLILLPQGVLPNLNDFEFSIKDSQISIDSYNENVSVIQRDSLSIQVELLNLTNKLKDYKSVAFFYSLSDRLDLIKKIFPNVELLYGDNIKLLNKKDFEQLLLFEFFGSRKFGFQDDTNDKTKVAKVLMPVIDYCNHNTHATSFYIIDSTLQILNYIQPDSDNLEVFVKYNNLCPIAKLSSYAFIDRSADRFYSRPLVVDLGEGRSLEIKDRIGLIKKDLDKSFKDIATFFPYVYWSKEVDNRIVLSNLSIPYSNAPLAMRRILITVFNSIWSDISNSEKMKMVKAVEDKVIEENSIFAKYLQNLKPLQEKEKSVIKMLNDIGVMLEQWLDAYKNNEMLNKIKLI